MVRVTTVDSGSSATWVLLLAVAVPCAVLGLLVGLHRRTKTSVGPDRKEACDSALFSASMVGPWGERDEGRLQFPSYALHFSKKGAPFTRPNIPFYISARWRQFPPRTGRRDGSNAEGGDPKRLSGGCRVGASPRHPCSLTCGTNSLVR
jgi:hypothetical protein